MSADAYQIHARRVHFDWDGTPLHWVPGDPFSTQTINVLHLLLPAGERWFCEVYRQGLPLVKSDRLREEVKGFIGQEAVHARAHQHVLDHLVRQGLDTTAYTNRIEWMFSRLLGDRPLGRLPVPTRRWLIDRMAIIAAIEHFTCVLGNWVLEQKGLDEAGADPTMLDLLRWHGAEEVEHASVAYDLFQEASGSYPRRVFAMVTVAPILLWLWVVGTRFLVRHDPTLRGAKPRWRDYKRAARRGRVPHLRSLFGAIPRYLRRDHHPSKEGSLDRAIAYLAVSPAAQAASREQRAG